MNLSAPAIKKAFPLYLQLFPLYEKITLMFEKANLKTAILQRNFASQNCADSWQQAAGSRQQAAGSRQQAAGNYTHALINRVKPLWGLEPIGNYLPHRHSAMQGFNYLRAYIYSPHTLFSHSGKTPCSKAFSYINERSIV